MLEKKQLKNNVKYYYMFNVSNYQFIVLLNSNKEIIYINMNDNDLKLDKLIELPLNEEVEREFKNYFKGAKEPFKTKYKLIGTEFQINIWNALKRVPYGKTITYSELAKLAGNEKAVRATASAVANNPIVIIIPCHRIIRKDGSIGEYSAGGPKVKKHLLEIEQAL